MPHALSDFIPSTIAMRGLIGVPPEIAEDAIRQAAMDLCDRAGVWSFELTLQTQAGVAEYPLLIPKEANVVGIKSVRVNDQEYAPNVWGARTCGCGGRAFVLRGLRAIYLTPVPDDPDPSYADIELWLKPAQDACELPNALYDEWQDVISDGAAARLFAIPKRDWSNPGLMQRYELKFANGVVRAKNKRVLMRSPGPLMMRGGYF